MSDGPNVGTRAKPVGTVLANRRRGNNGGPLDRAPFPAPPRIPTVLELPIRRCPECGYIGRTTSFVVGEGGPWEGRSLVCPRCGSEAGRLDPRLQ